MKKNNVILYTGNGGGKTAASLGLALRSVGHGKKVVIVQFMKGRSSIGEYLIKDRLAPEYVIRQFGREGFVDLKNPSQADKEKASEGFGYAKAAMKGKPFLLILDEINLAVATGLLDLEEVIKFIRSIPAGTIVVLTGRYAPKKLMDAADYVEEVRDVKRPAGNVPPREGFEY